MPDDTGKNDACPGDLSNPPNHGVCAKELTDASASHQDESEETGNLSKLKDAIQLSEQAIEADVSWCKARQRLAVQLRFRYLRTRMLDDLEKAVKLSQEILKIGPSDRLREYVLRFLALLLEMRYRETNSVSDLDETIFYNQESFAVTQQGPASVEYMANLGSFIWARFRITKALSDADETIR